ncbi:unnamed protein product [Adineta steineri]|uniref:Uncharacterized protein n=1 Tax=Adineta steineri TaxID=433720 RepID=A0A815J0U2_9BILA|nr:unnamed protein product [Adineta steineri]CAF3762474.1 unnamed protein product [Adineta steineri]
MSTQDMRKLQSVLRSIETIEEKTNALYSQYTTSINDNLQPILIDDSNIHLQTFFQHLEQLLELDLKNRKSLLNNNNNKRNYWNFFALALKESKGLYDTVLYVLNSQEVKTSTGRGRLFLRFCLQNHRLGDVIQQSFMTLKVVNQCYIDECFWTTPTYMNRIIQALYQLNDLQFDLLTNSQYQLDVCWPTIESVESRPKALSDAASRMRNSSVSSFLSMNSIDSQSIISVVPDISNSISITPSIFRNCESSINDGSSAQSLSSVDEDPENTVIYWKQKCYQLEIQLQEIQTSNLVSSKDIDIQCSIIENNQRKNSEESSDKEFLNKLNHENEQLKNQLTILKEEITNLNFQLSSISMQRSTTTDKIKDYERDLTQYQTIIKDKDTRFNELQQKYDEQTNGVQSIKDEYSSHSNEQNQQIEVLENELEKSRKLLEDERISMEKQRQEHMKTQEQLEASLQERTLDFEEMKRRLVKAVREKAELFNSIHSYEIKLEEEQSRKWVADEDSSNCTKCNTVFGWTVRKHHCRHCQKIFCYYCSNNWMQSSKTNSPQYRICDYCNDKLLKESLMPNNIIHSDFLNNHEITDNVDLHFEVRPERLHPTADTESTS